MNIADDVEFVFAPLLTGEYYFVYQVKDTQGNKYCSDIMPINVNGKLPDPIVPDPVTVDWTSGDSVDLGEYAGVDVSVALVNSVPASVKSQIDNSITYPSSLTFANENDEWMSKLTLDFYLSMLAKEGNLDAYQPITNEALLYDEINGADIEGGGRIIVAVDGKFEIPEDADSGLIYVGLDENYQPVTTFIYK